MCKVFKHRCLILPLQKLHHDERLTLVLTNVVDDADVGVIKSRCGAGFALEMLQRLAVVGKLFGKELQGYLTAQAGVLGPIDVTHTTATQFPQDAIA